MKYCNDKEKAMIILIGIVAIATVIYVQIRIRDAALALIDDIVYDAKKRFVLKQCDECIEKADKVHKENTAEDIKPKD